MRALLILLIISFHCSIHAQSPKREFRGVWIATVANIDWPSKPGLSSEQQQKEFIDILNIHKENGMNAVIVQVRPSADAFYNSQYEPWSHWFTGELGKYPSPYYDPLHFMVKEAHVRGLEFHAWFNPYRAIVDVEKNGIDSSSVVFKNPSWFVTYGKNMYFDPGLPEALKHTVNVIMDVVNRYDIDGVHFDDYFYPYRIAKTEFPDSASFEKYKGDFTKKDDWRRNNVDLLIKTLHDSIKQVKPYVQFGVSPFGVWRNKSVDPAGSDTRGGQTCYDDLYADVLKWMRKGWIDYILPQLYWSIGHKAAPYDVLVKWWNENNFNTPIIIGHGAYKINADADTLWKNPAQIGNQIRLNRQLKNINGSAFFSSKSFKSNPLGINDSLKSRVYNYHALPLKIISDSSSKDIQYAIRFTARNNEIQLFWEKAADLRGWNSRYVVYRFSGKEKINLEDPSKIIAIISGEHSFTDTTAKTGKKYTYVVSSLDRYNDESKPKEGFSIKASSRSWKTFDQVAIQ